MSIMGQNDPHSSGRLGVIIGKSTQGDRVTRVVTVRREKAGWKVVDISGQKILQQMRMPTSNRPRR